MFDKTQNMVCDIEIKDELLVDFSEIENENFQNKQNMSVKNELQNENVQCKNPSNFTKICSVKVKKDDLCNIVSKSLLELICKVI